MQARAGGAGPEQDFLLEEFLPYELSIAANRASRLFARRYSETFGLSIAQWRVMAVVGRFGTMAAVAVVERSEMDKVKVSRAVASLVAAGLVEQLPDPADGRARLLRLTRRGRQTHQAIVALARTLEGQLATALTAEEWDTLRRCLRKLYAHVRTLDAAEVGAAAGRPEPRVPE
ncbi:MAG: winged helix-turn-helix transcriptional regulator [Rhodospirillales bacterium]|nr:MarR family winged helix-turn-helix transcriptional regulator [Rhodospirillales bacterium]MDE2199572.1 winged helix-turn-helix transcriptional regulator [Rhodospirillales bacterium]MDE2575307.1 winged helix-turn-helix transcriptional regulator [Rhodospirillales bacterium]